VIPPDALRSARRILVVKLDEIGDLLLAGPFLRGLRASAPRARIDLVVSTAAAPLTIGWTIVDAVVVLAAPPGEDGRLDFTGRTPDDMRAFANDFGQGFDIAINARFDFDSRGAATLIASTRAPIRLAFSETVTPWKARSNAGFDRAYTHFPRAGGHAHEVERGLELLEELGGEDVVAGSPLVPPVVGDVSLEGVPLPSRFVVLAPTTASSRRNMPIARFAEVAEIVATRLGVGLVVVGSADGRERSRVLTRALTAADILNVDLTGRTDIRTTAAIIARAEALVGMDSGPAHIAASLGIPVAVISCRPAGGDPNDIHAPERFRPWGREVLVIEPPRALKPCSGACRADVAHCVTTIDPDAAGRRIAEFLRPDAPAPLRRPKSLRPSEVLVSFPLPPDAYPTRRHWHAQISRFVTTALRGRFGDRVHFVPWEAELDPVGRDALVTFLPHPTLARWKRSVVLENHTFDTNKWRFDAFRRYGLDVPLDSAVDRRSWIEGQYAACVLTNDVSLERLRNRDPRVVPCFDEFKRMVSVLTVHPHPIDKPFFSRLFGTVPPPDRPRLLIYHAGVRKNAAEMIATAREIGLVEGEEFRVVDRVDKDDDDELRYLLGRFPVIANASYSETGPINMIEYMVGGHLVLGNEEWWGPAGEPWRQWSHDPARAAENATTLDRIIRRSSVEELAAVRDLRRDAWLSRSDTDWRSYTDVVTARVEELLVSSHPA